MNAVAGITARAGRAAQALHPAKMMKMVKGRPYAHSHVEKGLRPEAHCVTAA